VSYCSIAALTNILLYIQSYANEQNVIAEQISTKALGAYVEQFGLFVNFFKDKNMNNCNTG